MDLDAAVKSAKKQIEKKDDELREAQKTYETNLAEMNKKNTQDFDKSLKDLQDLRLGGTSGRGIDASSQER